MKNLKKSLALMLVLVLALGMIPFASANPAHMNVDDFTDSASIVNREAADVLAALGVYRGDEGMFRPEGTFTRVFAATLMVRVMRGHQVVGDPPQTSTQFTDVPRSHWASGYVAEAVNLGLVVGISPTTFHPNREITRAEVAILLLRALGYGQDGEYSGDNWIGQAIFDGQRYGVLPRDTTIDFTAVASRDDVALYTFRAVIRPWVEYNTFSQIYFNTRQDMFGNYLDRPGGGKYEYEDAETLGAARFILTSRPGDDDFGFGTGEWLVRGLPITPAYSLRGGVVAEFMAAAEHTKHYMATNYSWPTELNWPNAMRMNENDELAFFVNGQRFEIDWASRTSLFERGVTDAWPFPAGAQVFLIDTYVNDLQDGIIDRIVIIYELLGQVTSVDADRGTITARVYERGDPNTTTFTGTIFAEGFNRDDYLLVAPKNAAASNTSLDDHDDLIVPDLTTSPNRVVAVDTLTGTASRTAGNFVLASYPGYDGSFHTVTVGDSTIALSHGIGMGFGDPASPLPSFTAESLFYLDSNGLIIGYEAAVTGRGAAGLDYILVTGIDLGFGATQGGRPPILVSGVSTTGEVYENIRVANYTVSGQNYPDIRVWRDRAGSATTDNLSDFVDLSSTHNGFNQGTVDAIIASTPSSIWFSYSLNEAGDRISLRDLRNSNSAGPRGEPDDIVIPSTVGSQTSVLTRQTANTAVIGVVSSEYGYNTTRNATDRTGFVIVSDGEITTNVTGVANFPDFPTPTQYGFSATANATADNFRQWLVILEENLPASQGSLTSVPRIAQIYVVQGQVTATANYGIIIEQLAESYVGGRDVHGYRIMRGPGEFEGTAASPVWIAGEDDWLDVGTIVATKPHTNATAAAAGVLIVETEPQGTDDSTGARSTVVNISNTTMTLANDAHLRLTDETMFVRVTNEATGALSTDARPRVEPSTSPQESDTVIAWYKTSPAADDTNAIAVVSFAGGQKVQTETILAASLTGLTAGTANLNVTAGAISAGQSVAGVDPTTALPRITANTYYTVTADWEELGDNASGGNFGDATTDAVYRITLTANTGYAFTGSGADINNATFDELNTTGSTRAAAVITAQTVVIDFTWEIAAAS